MLEIGSLVDGKYKVLRVVGQGGMSVVYQAVNEKANKIWAIKEVRKDGVQNYEVVKQNLIVETELLKRFNHPNLPSIIDVIDTEDSFLIVMDYIEGNSLANALKTSGAQSQEDVIEWSKQLCDVLGYLHSRKPPIIYRDMKPGNVMLKPDGNISLIDFGTAREFKSASVEDTTCLGTRGYAAPEQYGGHGQTDARTDIYCLGATMYHLVTGHNPSNPPYEMYPIRRWNPMLSSGLEEIIIKCTQRNPNDRYQSCAELLYALDHFQDLDIENKKVQSFKWKTFLVSVIIMLVMLVGTIGFKIAANSASAQTYGSLLDSAAESASNTPVVTGVDGTELYKNAADIYKEAIVIDPSRTDAYYGLIDLYLSDSVLSDAEYQDINNTLKNVRTGDGDYIKTQQALISANKQEFALLAREIGDDLFFCYEKGFADGIPISSNWYNKALENTTDENIIEDINRKIMIANCYIGSSGLNAKGESTGGDPLEVFAALNQVIDTINPQENIVLSLKCYTFISDLLGTKVDFFAKKVNLSDYVATLDKIDQKLNEVEASEDYKNNKDENDAKLLKTMQQARKHISDNRINGYGASTRAANEGVGE